MKRGLLLAGAALVLSSSMALAAPESLLPSIFDNPRPTPTPTRTAAPAPAPTVVPPQAGSPLPTVQPAPGYVAPSPSAVELPDDFPSIEEIEEMSSDEIDDLLGLKPQFDIPAGARRALSRIGVISRDEGGFPSRSLAGQPASLVRASLEGTKYGLVSRWGHILLRRTLASRLDAPKGMNPVEFAALRAGALNRIGEPQVARALVQDVDSSNYDEKLTDAAFDAYLATGDIVGMCPVARLKSTIRSDPQWRMTRAICQSFSGGGRDAARDLDRALGGQIAPRIDILLAQRYAGAASEGARSVNIEWDGVSELTPWRYSLSVALGIDVPEGLRQGAGIYYDRFDAQAPAFSVARRASSAEVAAGEGILSSSALIDLYSQIFDDEQLTGEAADRALLLREAYVANDEADRLDAIREIWGGSEPSYGRLVLTAYAAARISPSESVQGDAPLLIASMLTAGLDRNAMRWSQMVEAGSLGWALLSLARSDAATQVSSGDLDDFVDDDTSSEQRKSRFLVAGLAGMGRIDAGTSSDFADRLGVDLGRESNWSRMITRAAEVNNPALVAMLAGLGMQGNDWDMMTARHLYLIVRSLNQVGLSAEARMIAAEAVARG